MTSPPRDERLLTAARATKGFMPDDEGLALAAAAERAAHAGFDSIVEVGAYCGRSTLYLASGVARAVRATPSVTPGAVIFSVDHHHGSEENQAGWEHHDETLVDPETGRMDTLGFWRRTIEHAQAEDLPSPWWGLPCGGRAVERRSRSGFRRRRARGDPGMGRLPRLGSPASPKAGGSPSTTSSRTRPTAGVHRSRSTAGRSHPARSRRSIRPGREACEC